MHKKRAITFLDDEDVEHKFKEGEREDKIILFRHLGYWPSSLRPNFYN